MNSAQREIIRRHQNSAPVQMVPLANELGIQVYKVDSFPDGLSGMIRKEEDGGYAIYVNSTHHLNRRRFTMAHEIAHFLLHKDLIGDGIVDDALYRSGLGSTVEYEANQLAADILMPWHLLNSKEYEGLSVSELASVFEVSPASMGIRLKVPA